jgi:hypothetical protein
MRTINYLNCKWNRMIHWFHDTSVKLNIRCLIVLSIWALNNLTWTLPENWQLINNISLREYKMQRELEVAYHQIQYYANYAYELQWEILEQKFQEQKEEEPTSQFNPRKDHIFA